MKTERIGFYFPIPVLILGGVLLFLGVISIIQVTFLGVFIVPIGLFLLFFEFGSQLDCENRLFREYVGVFGFNIGEWKQLELFPFITVLKSRSGMTFYSQSNRSTSLIDDTFEVCLLNKTHRSKLLVQKLETKESALKYATKLAEEIKIEIVNYDPVVSEKTRLRRRSR